MFTSRRPRMRLSGGPRTACLLPASLLTASLLTASTAGAEPLVTDRPDVAESPEAVAPGRLQVETGALVTRDEAGGAQRWTFEAPTKIRVGVASFGQGGLELHIEGSPYQVNEIEIGALELTTDGVPDPEVGGKVQFNEGAGAVPTLGLLVALALPIGTDEVSEDRWGLSPTLAAGWALGEHWSVGLNTGTTTDLDEGDTSLRYALALGRDLGPWLPDLSLYGELFGEVAFADEDEAALGADAGLAYLVTEDVQLDAALFVGLTDAADDWAATLGLSFRI